MYLVAVVLLIVLFSVMLTWEWLAMSSDITSCATVRKQSRLGNEEPVAEEAIRLANVTRKLLQQQNRPLLVRFDWYSRKKTPVHMG